MSRLFHKFFRRLHSDSAAITYEGILMPETSARELIHEIGTAARRASRITACASTEKKNAALERIAQALMTRRDVIQAANAVDLANARSEGLSLSLIHI